MYDALHVFLQVFWGPYVSHPSAEASHLWLLYTCQLIPYANYVLNWASSFHSALCLNWNKEINCLIVWLENLKRRDHLEDLRVYWRIILKRNLDK